MKYAVVFEQSNPAYAAYVPDLPGCITTGRALDETGKLIQEAMEFHVEGMRLHGETIAEPTTATSYIEVSKL